MLLAAAADDHGQLGFVVDLRRDRRAGQAHVVVPGRSRVSGTLVKTIGQASASAALSLNTDVAQLLGMRVVVAADAPQVAPRLAAAARSAWPSASATRSRWRPAAAPAAALDQRQRAARGRRSSNSSIVLAVGAEPADAALALVNGWWQGASGLREFRYVGSPKCYHFATMDGQPDRDGRRDRLRDSSGQPALAHLARRAAVADRARAGRAVRSQPLDRAPRAAGLQAQAA